MKNFIMQVILVSICIVFTCVASAQFNSIKTNSKGNTFFRISGNRNNANEVVNTNANNFVNKAIFEFGAATNTLIWK